MIEFPLPPARLPINELDAVRKCGDAQLRAEFDACVASLLAGKRFDMIGAVISEYKSRLHAGMEAWKEFATHQECCGVCAESIDECSEGHVLGVIARRLTHDL